MAWDIAASAALNIWGASEQAKALAKQEAANLVLAREQDNLAFNREMQAFLQNQTALGKQKTVDDLNISIAAAEAKDNLILAKTGSNLSGPSMNELDNEISRGVNAERVAAQRAYDQGLDANNQQRITASENRKFTADHLKSNNYTNLTKSAFIGSAIKLGLPSVGSAVFESAQKESSFDLMRSLREAKTNLSNMWNDPFRKT